MASDIIISRIYLAGASPIIHLAYYCIYHIRQLQLCLTPRSEALLEIHFFLYISLIYTSCMHYAWIQHGMVRSLGMQM